MKEKYSKQVKHHLSIAFDHLWMIQNLFEIGFDVTVVVMMHMGRLYRQDERDPL